MAEIVADVSPRKEIRKKFDLEYLQKETPDEEPICFLLVTA